MLAILAGMILATICILNTRCSRRRTWNEPCGSWRTGRWSIKSGRCPKVEYSFKHVLTQETVYQSIPRRRREVTHQRVAGAIETLYRESLDAHYERLAYHYGKSAEVETAIEYLLKAGEKARRSYANEEAIAHFTRGLELLKALPETPQRDR